MLIVHVVCRGEYVAGSFFLLSISVQAICYYPDRLKWFAHSSIELRVDRKLNATNFSELFACKNAKKPFVLLIEHRSIISVCANKMIVKRSCTVKKTIVEAAVAKENKNIFGMENPIKLLACDNKSTIKSFSIESIRSIHRAGTYELSDFSKLFWEHSKLLQKQSHQRTLALKHQTTQCLSTE